jgi:hypothetical protein
MTTLELATGSPIAQGQLSPLLQKSLSFILYAFWRIGSDVRHLDRPIANGFSC